MMVFGMRENSPGRYFESEGVRRWYVANVHTGREKEAEAHLRNQGFVPFNPLEVRTVRSARRLVTKLKSFFPGYLFVEFDVDEERWRSINSTRGVRSLIMQSERPIPCPGGLVEKLIEAADEAGVINLSTQLQPGQRVKVRSGPFAEFVGTLQKVDMAGRAQVLLEVMSGERAVKMDSQILRAI